jgi:hypothetical protein
MVDVYRTPGTGPDRPTAAYRAMCKVARRLYSQEWWPVDGQWLPLNSDNMAWDFDRDPELITPAEADALADLAGPECP